MPGESYYTAPKALEHVTSRMFQNDFPEISWRDLIPAKTDVDPGDDYYAFETEEFIGQAAISHTYGTSAPKSDAKVSKDSRLIVPILGSFEYSIQDVRAATRTGRSLPDAKARSARQNMERALDDLMLEGSADFGIEGLFNNSNVTSVDAVTGGSGTAWSTKTTAQKMQDILTALAVMVDATNGIEGNVVDIILPVKQYVELATARVSDTGMTAMSYIMSNIPQIRSFSKNHRLKNISGTDERMVMYNRDSAKLEGIVPLDLEPHDPQRLSSVWTTLLETRSAGCVLYKPRSVYYVDKI